MLPISRSTGADVLLSYRGDDYYKQSSVSKQAGVMFVLIQFSCGIEKLPFVSRLSLEGTCDGMSMVRFEEQ